VTSDSRRTLSRATREKCHTGGWRYDNSWGSRPTLRRRPTRGRRQDPDEPLEELRTKEGDRDQTTWSVVAGSSRGGSGYRVRAAGCSRLTKASSIRV
jgi:hypothetical protein